MNKISNLFRLRSFSYDSISAQVIRKGGHSLIGLIVRLIPSMKGKVTPCAVAGIKSCFRHFSLVASSQGVKGLVLRLKASAVSCQQAIGGYVTPNPLIARTGDGYPRWIPANWRVLIRKGHKFYIRLVLTLSSVYRDIVYPSPVKIATITKPYTGKRDAVQNLKRFIPAFITLFAHGNAARQLLVGKFQYFPIAKASPQSKGVISTDPLSLVRSAKVLTPEQIESIRILSKISCLNNRGVMIKDPVARITLARRIPNTIKFLAPFSEFSGKLGLKQEAAGKMRVFAMVDPWTQMVMAPLHKAIFRVLSKHPAVDGTFNQLLPIERLWRSYKSVNGTCKKPLYSMDLSAATDRLPMALQIPLIQGLFNLTDQEVNAWSHLLVGRDYMVPKSANLDVKSVRYAVGQPMGALSSWAMLALTHHFLVQASAWSLGYNLGSLYTDYCVLGDDIVIYNHRVAKRYHEIMTVSLGVECNLAKSVLSPKGLALEFAKRTFFLGENVSPTPLKEFFAALESLNCFTEYCNKYQLNASQACKVAGFGWRVISSLNKPFNKLNIKVRYLILMMAVSRGDSSKFQSSFIDLRPYYKDSMFYFTLLNLVSTMIFRTEKDLTNLLKKAKSLDIEDPDKRVSTVRVQTLKFKLVNGIKKTFIKMNIIPINHCRLDYISHLQLPFALFVQASVIRNLTPLIPKIGKLRQDISFLSTRLLRGRVEEVCEGLPLIWGTLLDVLKIKATASIISVETLWTKASVSRRPGEPKIFRLHQAYKSVAKEIHSFIKHDERTLVATLAEGNRVKESGINLIPILMWRSVRWLFLKPLNPTPIWMRMMPKTLGPLGHVALQSFGLRSLISLWGVEFLIGFCLFVILYIITALIMHDNDALASFLPLWIMFSTKTITCLEFVREFWNMINGLLYSTRADVVIDSFSFVFLTKMTIVIDYFIWYLGDIQSHFDLVTSAWHDGRWAILGALSRILFCIFLKPWVMLLSYPLSYVKYCYALMISSGFYQFLHIQEFHDWFVSIYEIFWRGDIGTLRPTGNPMPGDNNIDEVGEVPSNHNATVSEELDSHSVWSDSTDSTVKPSGYSDYFVSPTDQIDVQERILEAQTNEAFKDLPELETPVASYYSRVKYFYVINSFASILTVQLVAIGLGKVVSIWL